MNGTRVKQLRAELSYRYHATRNEFRRAKKDYNRPPSERPITKPDSEPTTDSRDKTRFAHGKMKRAGIFATRPRT